MVAPQSTQKSSTFCESTQALAVNDDALPPACLGGAADAVPARMVTRTPAETSAPNVRLIPPVPTHPGTDPS